MKENKYNDPVFFDKYSQMARSKNGLESAGEWHTLKKMLPDFLGKSVLDLGCGYGWHCIYAAQHGAKKITGIDISDKMLTVAKEKSAAYTNIHYQCLPIEDAEFSESSFDIVLSSLVFHYLDRSSFQSVVQNIYDWLRPGGVFVFSAEHPVFTAAGPQDWDYDKNGNIRHFPVDRYFYEGQRTARFLDEPVLKYHRTMTTYAETLLRSGFSITGLAEPQPPEHLIDTVPGMKDELLRPMMVLFSAEKPR